MRVLGVLALAAAAIVASTAGRGSASPSALLAVVGQGPTTRLATVDPLTLAPVGRSTQIGRYGWPWTRSPSGSRVAFVGDSGRIRIVDLNRMRTTKAFRLRANAIDDVVWPRARVLIILIGGLSVVAVDPVTTRVLWRRVLPNQVELAQRTRDGFVLLVPSAEGTDGLRGPTLLIAIGADGKLRSVPLELVRSGGPDFTGTPPAGVVRRPGLAVDPVRQRAYVVGAEEPIAEVDLRSLAVTYHGGTRTLAKNVVGPVRSARWLGDGLIAVTGADLRGESDGEEQATPFGVALVDTRDWSWRQIDTEATGVVVAGGVILATGTTGITGYSLAGSRLYHVFDRAVDLQATAGMAYARFGSGTSVVDLGSGRVVNIVPRSDVVPLTAS